LPDARILLAVYHSPIRTGLSQPKPDSQEVFSRVGETGTGNSVCWLVVTLLKLSQCIGVAYAVSSTCALAVLLFWIATENDKVVSMILLQCFSSWCVCITSRVEHLKTVRPSHFLQASLVLSIPHELFWLQRLKHFDDLILAVSGYMHAVLLGVLICVESCDKRHLFLSEVDRKRSQEETSGFFRQRLFWYLNGLFRKGMLPCNLTGAKAY
jgi:hypothetical protein